MPVRKTVIYTAIAGESDVLQKPSVVDRKHFDYVCFTDTFPSPIFSGWSIRKIPPGSLDNVRRAKEYKCLPHRFFRGYERSIWIDGNIDIIGDIDLLLKKFYNEPLVCFKHPNRDCAYREAEACIRFGKDAESVLRNQIECYRREGFPERAGLIEANVLIRRHNDADLIRLMEAWWAEILTHSRRDQLSLPYVAWKLGARFALMDKENARGTSPYFRRRNHVLGTLRNRVAVLKDNMLTSFLWRP